MADQDLAPLPNAMERGAEGDISDDSDEEQLGDERERGGDSGTVRKKVKGAGGALKQRTQS